MKKTSTQEEPAEKEHHVSIYVILYKLILGVIESAAGVTIAVFGSRIFQMYEASLLKELSEDPHDTLAHLSESVVPNLLTHSTIVVLYLLALGLAKVAGAVGLIYGKNWGVDVLVLLTIILAPFQIVNLLLHPHIFDLLYFITGIAIALYLVEFNPKAWVSQMIMKVSKA